ncbi:MAG TPA: TRAM domain-containing protein [Polyangia bacterium]|jgi:23S rRNA (uracil1939-C5)-methyltransferase|nr:TRAM domain-containing protein [Polyangia bacterium]
MTDGVFVDIESLAPGGDGVGRQRGAADGEAATGDDDGRVTFVPLAAPGERVRARIVRAQGRVAWGELLSIENPGPDRVAPVCPLFGTCGGCQWQHVSMAAQHAAKKVIVERALGISIPPVIAASRPFGYRDRVKLAVGGGRVGFRERRSHQIVDVPACPLVSERLARALSAVRALGTRLPDGGEIDVQAGADGVCIDVARVDGAGAAYARREWDRLQAGGVVGLSLAGKPTHGQASVNVAEPASSPLPASASGFAQVGHEANAVLVAAVLDAVGASPGHVVELYAGSGNFTRHLVARAASVRAFEADPAAVDRGRLAVPAATWGLGAPKMASAVTNCDLPIDLVLLDPPREGGDALNLAVAQQARSRIVYVSCDPQTLSRDARRIATGGFRLARALALDLMPQTHHVEVVAVFVRA